ncbi:DUF11 domain-containing protein [Novilysobacter antarcticus]|uniref:DUF11 domain-containing protein n=1 Tax=Novilysobacter antarcticus TaxID=2862543 RepID=UPI001C99B6E6|nr:DUF11 domain-containing protein [Lysobacter antarcticus]
MPGLTDQNGNPLDVDVAEATSAARFYPGQPVLLRLDDANRNQDLAVREYVEVKLTTSTGDEETLRLQETGVNTGVFAVVIASMSTPPSAIHGDCRLSLADEGTLTAVYGDPDFPGDRVTLTVQTLALEPQRSMLLAKQVSLPTASAGDILQYRLSLQNKHDDTIRNVVITDTLPAGMRYQHGSLRVGDKAVPDPTVTGDGRSLAISVGDLSLDAGLEITYLVAIASDIRAGQAINRAQATGLGRLVSNEAMAAVRIEEPLLTSHFTIVGRVLEGECGLPAADLQGVSGVRLLLDDGTYVTTDQNGAYHFEGVRPGTHVVQMDLDTLPPDKEAVACNPNSRFAGRAFSQFVEANGGSLWRADFRLRGKPLATSGGVSAGESIAASVADEALTERRRARLAILNDATAAGGGDVDWFAGRVAGAEWLFPGLTYNPRSPTTRIVIKHAPGQKVVLSRNGEPVSAINYDGSSTSADKSIAITRWTAVPLADGDNLFVARLQDTNGNVVARLDRTVHYSGAAARAVLVPEQSVLVADGIQKPVIAVRLLDRSGRPVRAGVTGAFQLSAPYLPAQTVQAQQERQLAGLDRFQPSWHVEGDDGVAYIELAPTSVAGSAELQFRFQDNNGGSAREDELSVWLESSPRDWVVVGFASGTVGYDTLKGNAQALAEQGEQGGLYTDGQLSLYAKGRVQGKWMLTLAYDSDKPTDRLNRQNLLSSIDPEKFYTLYGDTTQQGYDASSTDKLYVKLERDQFYALFGDYVTGLDRTQLSRYNRTLNGVKVEYRGPVVEFSGFAAETDQNFARDEIQGNGTSGLYRLSRGNVAINGERVRIETRDRFRSEIILETRTLTRHLDYDIDYGAGTLFFREPIASRDFGFNPTIIVVEYETIGRGDQQLNAGGRVGAKLLDGRLAAGVTYLSEKDSTGNTRLAGVDAKLKVSDSTELRVEVASSDGDDGLQDRSGSAYLVELEHHGARFDALAYVRRQAPGFGVNQQNASESGMYKIGLDTQWRVDEKFALQQQAYHQEDLVGGATRDAVNAQLDYRAEVWGARAGLQVVRDQALTGEVKESRQLTLGGNRSLLDKRLELSVAAELGLAGRNESVDFPTRLQLGAAYAINDALRLIAAQEFTDGETRDTATTRLGFEVVPWKGARLTSTLNQSQISEYGPRTFGLFGLNQSLHIGKNWAVDLALDTSHAFNASGDAPPLTAPGSGPIAPGGIRDGGALTEDFTALSAGATYRSELWSWNGRIEGREADTSDRYGFTTAFLRQIDTGMAFAASAQAFSVGQALGGRGLLANVGLSWAWRPLGSQWSLLNRLELRLDELRNGSSDSVIGQNTMAVTGDARSRRLVNNFVINHVSDEWTAEDMQGNLFEAGQRSQWSLYYGSKYVFDRYGYDGRDYAGYTDIIGLEWRFDVNQKFDIGLRGSVRHAWSQNNFSYAVGPVMGVSPFTNAWFSVGYNVVGFEDRDFDSAHYTRQGAYLMMRFKFDQSTPALSGVLDSVGRAR